MKKVLLSLLTAIVMLPFAANAATYTVAGSAAILNGSESWAPGNADNDMVSEDGVNYTLTISGINVEAGSYEFKVVMDHDWNGGQNAWPSSNWVLNIAESAKYDIVYTFNADTKDITCTPTKVGDFEGTGDKTYTVAGSAAVLGSEWTPSDTNNDMVKGTDGIYRLVKENVALEAATYEYKVVVNHDWGTAYPSSNAQLVIAEAGNYNVTFTFNEETKEVGATATAIVEVTEKTVTFDFSSPDFRANIGTAMADVAGFIYNETFTAGGATLQITGGSAPSRIYNDTNRGQCLATYKEYTTLTFEAPEGMAITKIEFTAAGNSNIKNFTASSGSIEGMVWTGNAEGVRFTQGGTSYLANAIVTLTAADDATEILMPLEYKYCANIAAFNALENGTYAWLKLTDAEVIGKSADGYSTVFIQDATGGAWIQYTSLNDRLQEMTKISGDIYTIKRVASGNPQLKEAEDTPDSKFEAAAISALTVIEGSTIAAVNVPENLNRVVKFTGATLEQTSTTAGTLTLGEETIDVNNGNATANQQLHKIAEWAKDTKLENVTIVAILVAKSATANQLLPISIELAGETEAGEELNVERYPSMGYTPTEATVDFTAAKAFLGVEEVTDNMLVIINPDGTEVSSTITDGWFDGEGKTETWGENARINVKFFEAIPEGTYSICDMNGADEVGKTYTTKWALKANGKSYIYNINVTFVEAPDAGELTKSDLSVVTSVEYTVDEGSYVTKWATLTDEQVTAICTELGFQSLSEVTVYGYNPTTGELLTNYAGFDGWRDANGDFHNWSGDATVPFCIKYSDGQNYECYNIGGLEPQTFKGYWAIANDQKYVLVEIDFIYNPAPAIELTLTDVEEEITVTYNVTEDDYTEKTIELTSEQLTKILTATELQSLEDENLVAYIYNPTTKEFSKDSSDGWRDANGLGHNWTGNAEAPACTQFRESKFYFYNLYGMDPQTITTYFAIANNANGKAALVKVNFVYEGTYPTYTVAGAFKVGEEETASFFGTAWDATAEANDMTKTDRTIWTLHFDDIQLPAGTIYYKVVADHNWDTNWGFDGNNADYVVNLPDLPAGAKEGAFDITFTFNPVGTLSNGYNVSCDVVYDEAVTVGIRSMATDCQANGAIYNLQGVRLNQLQKGVNIVNGKKVVIK